MERLNPIQLTDVYNLSHFSFKKNNNFQVSYIYNRKKSQIMWGFEKLISDILNHQITKSDVDEAEKNAKKTGLWFDRKQFDDVIKDFNGFLPIEVKVVPDGYYVPKGTPFCEVYNNVHGYADLVTWIESRLLKGWWGCCAATEAYEIRKYLDDNNMNVSRIHNFAFRSYPSDELAVIADDAWAFFLPGSDGFYSSIRFDITSIPAASHNIMQQFDDEIEACKNIIDVTKRKNKSICAVPIDTYNSHTFIEEKIDKIQEYAESNNITVLYRVDSGDKSAYSVKLNLRKLPHIISDGVDFDYIKYFDEFVSNHKKLSINLVNYGMGAGWWKNFSRDYLGWAMKVGFYHNKDCMKVSDDPVKRSLPGLLNVIINNDNKIEVIEGHIFHNQDNTLYKKITKGYHDFDLYKIKKNFDLCKSKGILEQNEVVISDEIKKKIEKFINKPINA